MKYRFKSKNKNFIKLNKIILITILLIILFTFFLFKKFNNINNNIINITTLELEKKIYTAITQDINHDLLNKDNLKDLLIITKNKQDEILYVDFDLAKAYLILDNVGDILNNIYKKMETGEIEVNYLDENISHSNSLNLNIPLGSILNNTYFYNLGPKIPVKVNYVGTVLTNLETKITNYGMNNALVELFVYLEFHNTIVAPFKSKDITLKYNAIIASLMIEGAVPSVYNGVLESQSNVYSKTIN